MKYDDPRYPDKPLIIGFVIMHQAVSKKKKGKRQEIEGVRNCALPMNQPAMLMSYICLSAVFRDA